MDGEGIFDDLKRVAKKAVKKKVQQGVEVLKDNAAHPFRKIIKKNKMSLNKFFFIFVLQ